MVMKAGSLGVLFAAVSAACGREAEPHAGPIADDQLSRCFASSGDEPDGPSKCERNYFGTDWRKHRPASAPDAAPSGDLDPRLVQASIEAHEPRFRACYRAGVARDPNLRTGSREVKVRFVISETGRTIRVEDAGSRLKDARVLSCIRGEFAAIRFPPPEGGFVPVVWPMLFAPGDTQH
jgi:hypothetical protein